MWVYYTPLFLAWAVRDKYGEVGVKRLEDGEGGSSSESSFEEEEDEDAEALTPQVERDFLRTLALIKSKDPRIYDKQVSFFSKGITPWHWKLADGCWVKGRQLPILFMPCV